MAAALWARGGWPAAGRSFSSGAPDASASSAAPAGQTYASAGEVDVPGGAGAAFADVPGEPFDAELIERQSMSHALCGPTAFSATRPRAAYDTATVRRLRVRTHSLPLAAQACRWTPPK